MIGQPAGAELMNYLNKRRQPSPEGGAPYHTGEQRSMLEFVEAAVYCADDARVTHTQLELLLRGSALTLPEYLSSETAVLDSESALERARPSRLESLVRRCAGSGVGRGYLAEKIDLYSGYLRR